MPLLSKETFLRKQSLKNLNRLNRKKKLNKRKKLQRTDKSLRRKMPTSQVKFQLLMLSEEFKGYRKVMFFFKKALKYTMWASTVIFFYHFYILKQGAKDGDGKPKISIFWQMANDADWHLYNMHLMLTRPPVEKLMPDRPKAPPGAMYPKTLVLNLRGTLIHSEYKFGVGFEVQKRPGLSTFINRLARQYELVIFGDEEQGIVQDICMALDPNGQFIPGRFGREATLLKNGQYIKDLSYLNRPIKDIIYVDFDESKVAYHKENAIKLSFWDGDQQDRELIDLLPFLESIAQ